ncbi:MAG TPA: ATP-binding protein [Trebonia sp.]|nr:ATP-binding protein [Trebonia sp.]
MTGTTSHSAGVIGREREIAVVSAFLDAVPRGPRALLVDGEAGIGKSTVWFEAVRLAEARGYRVLQTRPAESEAKLSYAAWRTSSARRSTRRVRSSRIRRS